jgi:hypothetical protein
LYKRIALALAAASIAGAAKHFSVHLVSGMDTCFAMLYFTIYLLLLKRWERSPSAVRAIVAGAAGGFVFGVRPDLLAFTVLVPIAAIFLVREVAGKRAAVVMLGTTAVVLAGQMAWAQAYLHSALPLSFYVKGLRARPLYPGLQGHSGQAWVGVHQLAIFVDSHWMLFAVIGLDWIVDPGRWWRDVSPTDKGLMAGAAICTIYFAVLALPLMPDHQRFYYPALPALIYLGGTALVRLLQRVPLNWIGRLGQAPKRYRYGVIAAAFLPLLVCAEDVHIRDLSELARGDFASLDLTEEYRAYWENYWVGLDRFSSLPADFVMATSEYGHPAAMNLDKEVIDMSGLNDILFARRPFSAAVMFQHYRPDLIYMPHPDFAGMLEDLETNPTFERDYQFIPGEKLCAGCLGVALRRDSKYYPAMTAVVNDAVQALGVRTKSKPQ